MSEPNIQLDKFKEEYTKQNVKIKNLSFRINKIPAFKAASFFAELVSRFASVNANLNANIDSLGAVNMIQSALTSLDADYLDNTLMPKVFEHITVTQLNKDGTPNLNGLNNTPLLDCQEMLGNMIDFDDVLELLVRGICVNFLGSLLARLSKLRAATQISSPEKQSTFQAV